MCLISIKGVAPWKGRWLTKIAKAIRIGGVR
jgi:hypothetical protein